MNAFHFGGEIPHNPPLILPLLPAHEMKQQKALEDQIQQEHLQSDGAEDDDSN